MSENSIQRIDAHLPAVQQSSSIMDMMQRVVERENPQDMAGALEQLVKLKEHVEDRDARKAFFQAFARAQAKLQTVVATMGVPDKQGNVRWYVAPFQDILDSIEPVLREEGFSLRFDSERNGAILTAICWAMHNGGHQESARCHFNAASAQGGDLGALTSAKRGALMEMFALKIRRSDDARLLGDFIEPDELDELQKMIAEAGNVPMPQFLKFAGAPKLEDIRKGKLPQLRTWLTRRVAGKPAQPAATDPPPVEATPAKVDAGWCMAFRAKVQKKRAKFTDLSDEDFIARVCSGKLDELNQHQADALARELGAGAFDWETGERLPDPN